MVPIKARRLMPCFFLIYVHSFLFCSSLKVIGNLDPVVAVGDKLPRDSKKTTHCSALTFVEALLTVQDGDPEPFETGGPVELTMVLVELSI